MVIQATMYLIAPGFEPMSSVLGYSLGHSGRSLLEKYFYRASVRFCCIVVSFYIHWCFYMTYISALLHYFFKYGLLKLSFIQNGG